MMQRFQIAAVMWGHTARRVSQKSGISTAPNPKQEKRMKAHVCAFLLSHRVLACSALFCLQALAVQATGPDKISILRSAPLSLPRLAPGGEQLGVKPMRSTAFETLTLVPGGRTILKYRGTAAYLAVEAGDDWQQELRNHRAGANYVTFTLHASLGTQIDVGGASLVIEQSERDPTYAAIHTTGADSRIDHETPWMLFGGARMAPLYIVTIKLDRKAGTWAIWFRDALAADDLPLSPRQGTGNAIHITAGKAGAWICGLVCSDENPLFEDANDNAVPDDFEQQVLGKLLETNAAEPTRAALRVGWQMEKQSRPPSVFIYDTPAPDNFPADCSPEGQIEHNMPNGLKYGAPRN